MVERSSGVLCHVTSLPSAHGVGDLGPEAYRFVDFLARAGQSVWQILPLNPTEAAHGYSPYSVPSIFAGNPILISAEVLVEDGYLDPEDLAGTPIFAPGRADYQGASRFRSRLLDLAWRRFAAAGDPGPYGMFCREEADWLEDYALFAALRSRTPGQAWTDWEDPLRHRDPDALALAKEKLDGDIQREKFLQYLFSNQWRRLRSYAGERGVRILGDLPIYVNHDSADVWAHPQCFKLDAAGRPAFLAGVPPDHFSASGQLWGNPVYNWENLRSTGYRWWFRRLDQALSMYDLIRIDHFRGLVAYWEVEAGATSALEGKWVEAPAEDFLNAAGERGYLPRIIAEDLGFITADVRRVMEIFGLPGMKVLRFAFLEDDPGHPYLPHNYDRRCVVYTGTHDNLPVRGWLEDEATEPEKERLFDYLGRKVTPGEAPWALVRMAMMSVADLAVFPMQDLLGLGAECALNRPSTLTGNWLWRLKPGQADDGLARRLRRLTRTCGRVPETQNP